MWGKWIDLGEKVKVFWGVTTREMQKMGTQNAGILHSQCRFCHSGDGKVAF